MRGIVVIGIWISACFSTLHAFEATKGSEILAKAIVATGEAREKLLEEFGNESSYGDAPLVESWRRGEVWLAKLPDGSTEAVVYNGKTGTGMVSAAKLGDGKSVTFDLAQAAASNPDRASRKLLTKLGNVIALKHPSDRNAAKQLGLQGDEEGLRVLKDLLPKQTSPAAIKGFQEGIALAELKLTKGEEKKAAVVKLGELGSLTARDQLKVLLQAETAKPMPQDVLLITAIRKSLGSIEAKQSVVEFGATLFRGLSLGSVLLVVAIGLAITFGLMGVINMAHGEFITIGGYTCYLVQTWFINKYGSSGPGFDNYFLVSLPLCF